MKNTLTIKILCFIWLSVICATTFSQPRLDRHFSYKNYTTYDGLSQSQVTHLYQDTKGYLWVCTKGGVSRFDGKNFKNFFSEKESYSLDHVVKIFEYNGLYYFQTQTGLTKYKGVDLLPVETIPYPNGIISGHYDESLTVNDTLFIFNCYGQSKQENIHLIFDLKSNRFDSLFTDERIIHWHQNKEGRYLFGHKYYYKLESTGVSKPTNLNADYHAYTILGDDQLIGCVHFQDKYQLHRLSFKNGELRKEIFYKPLIEMSNWLNQSFISSSDRSNIYYLDKNKFYHSIQNGIDKKLFPIEIPVASFEDLNGNRWFGAENGIYNTYHLLFEEYRFNVGQKVDNVWNILQDNLGNMWFGGYENGIWSLDRNEKVKILHPESIYLDKESSKNFSRQYMAGCRDDKGNLFFSYPGRILVLTRKDTINITLGNHTSLFIFNDEKNNRILSLGTNTQSQISKDDWKAKPIPGETKIIVSCVELNNGHYLLGSYHGQYVFDNEKITALSDTFAYQGVISMHADSLGNIWKGTTAGLYLSAPDGEKQIAEKQIGSSTVSSVYCYKNLLFVGVNRSLYLLDIDNYYKNNDERVKIFNQHNGFVAMDDAQNGFFLDRDSFLWYPAVDKVIRFKPEELAALPFPCIPMPYIVSVTATNKDNKSLMFYEPDTTVQLSKNTNALRFEFFSSAFNSPDDVVYRHKLTGYDENWSEPTKETTAIFTNLKYGNYRIEVQSSIDCENWSLISSSATFSIRPYWWQLWYAKTGFALIASIALILLTVIIVKTRQQRIIQKLEEQRRLNELRLQSVRSKHIPHFSGNALANIEHYIFSSDLRQANKFLSKYSRLMNLTLRDADLASRSIQQELEYVSLYLELEKMRFQDKIEYSFQIDPLVDQSTPIPNMLLHTWVENSIKHGICHINGVGKIEIRISFEHSNLHIAVSDNGVGREKAKALATSGTGNGLKILAEQLTIYNHFSKLKAELRTTDLTDEIGSATGTCFELILPVGFKFEI